MVALKINEILYITHLIFILKNSNAAFYNIFDLHYVKCRFAKDIQQNGRMNLCI